MLGGGGGGGGAKHAISRLNQWCSQDNTCSHARTAGMCVAYYMQIYETKCGYEVLLFPTYCLVKAGKTFSLLGSKY